MVAQSLVSNIIPFPRRARPIPTDISKPDRPEVIATLLLTLEERPFGPLRAFGLIDMTGRAVVGAAVDGVTLCLTPTDARLAARALVDEQAYAGCMGAARQLTLAADQADQAVLRRGAGA